MQGWWPKTTGKAFQTETTSTHLHDYFSPSKFFFSWNSSSACSSAGRLLRLVSKRYYPARGKLWKLKKALYGLRDAPRAWQEHSAEARQDMGGRRLKSDTVPYYFFEYKRFMPVHVDDVTIVGLRARELTPGKSANSLEGHHTMQVLRFS